jgi:D-alanine--poly(phosphoribitol) ligase subunit 2
MLTPPRTSDPSQAGQQQVEAEVTALLVAPPDRNTDLLDTGLIDSMGLVDLVLGLERQFGITVPLDTIDFDHFRTVARIAAFVAASRP